MEFIKNHFYKLREPIPIEETFNPSWYKYYHYNLLNGTISNPPIYCCNDNDTVTVNELLFTVGKIYQAKSALSLLDNRGNTYKFMDENTLNYFEEVDIGLDEKTKKFIQKQSNSNKMDFMFKFVDDNLTFLSLVLKGRYYSVVYLGGSIKDINKMVFNGYTLLKKNYVLQIKRKFLPNKKLKANFCIDLETNGFYYPW